MHRLSVSSIAFLFWLLPGIAYSQSGWTRSGNYWVPNQMIAPLPYQVRQHYYPEARSAPAPRVPSDIVTKVIDGDTVEIASGQKVRLYNIDAPELSQDYGPEAAAELINLVEGRRVNLIGHGYDKYNRALGELLIGTVNINAVMVSRGAAWDSSHLNGRSDPRLHVKQRSAKSQSLGLWRSGFAEPPWEFRARN